MIGQVARQSFHIKHNLAPDEAAAMWQALKSDLNFEPNSHLVKVSGPPATLDPFARLMRVLQTVTGRYLHCRTSEKITKEIAVDCGIVFPEVDVVHIYGQTILVREGEQGTALLKALEGVVDISG